MQNIIELFFLALASSFFLVWMVKILTVKFRWVSVPQVNRWNSRTVSLHGGVGFFPVIALGFVFLIFQSHSESISVVTKDPWQLNILISILLGSTIMFILGFVDDIFNCNPIVKVLVQAISVAIFVYNGGGFLVFESVLLNTLVTFFWFIIVINAVNLMDNMDGLASGIVVISLIFMIFSSALGMDDVFPLSVYMGVIVIASLLAFLLFNWMPATIFMGDSGSLSIGFILASLLIPSPINHYLGIVQGENLLTIFVLFLTPSLIIIVLLFDVMFVTITRFFDGRNIMTGGRDHTSHRLVLSGLTEKKSIYLLYFFSTAGGIGSILFTVGSFYSAFFISFLITVLLVKVWIYLSKTPVD